MPYRLQCAGYPACQFTADWCDRCGPPPSWPAVMGDQAREIIKTLALHRGVVSDGAFCLMPAGAYVEWMTILRLFAVRQERGRPLAGAGTRHGGD